MSEQADRDALAEVLKEIPGLRSEDVVMCSIRQQAAGAILASDVLAQRDRRVAAKALREALDPQEDADMLRAMLLDAADRLGNPRHRGNEHPWPKHAAMFRRLANRINPDDHQN